MKKKILDLKDLPNLIADGPVGRERIEKQNREIRDLQESLNLIVRRHRPYAIPVQNARNTVKFGLIGDTHIGSLYHRNDALTAFYKHCESQGITDVLHAGDVLAGMKIYKGQEYELHPDARSWDEQRDMFIAKAPKIDSITTHFITGNHDAAFKKLIGLVAGPYLSEARPDWKFVGQDIGTVTFTVGAGFSFRVMLIHPGGGSSYALSYRLQKLIESLSGGQKPDMLAVGHYHKATLLPAYRNIYGVQVGTFEAQTPFMAAQASQAHMGGWVIEVVLNERDRLTSRITATWIGFFEEDERSTSLRV